MLKTKIAEDWLDKRGFRNVSRVDRRLKASDRLHIDEPRVALSGLDKISARRELESVGFDVIVDAGFGRTARDFDKYRVSVFEKAHTNDQHFDDVKDREPAQAGEMGEAYNELENEVGACGDAEYAGASIATPFVSAYAASSAVSRLIALFSGCKHPPNETGRLLRPYQSKYAKDTITNARGISHSGKSAFQGL